MDDPSGFGEWRPDPTGRHQLRWWDGSKWSDFVADQGETTSDPMDESPPVPTAASPGADRTGRSPRLVAAAVAALIALGIAFVVLTSGGGATAGLGEHTASLEPGEHIEVRTVKVPGKSLVRVRVEVDGTLAPAAIVVLADDAYMRTFNELADLTDMLDQSDLSIINQGSDKYSEPSDLYDRASESVAKYFPGADLTDVVKDGDVAYQTVGSIGAEVTTLEAKFPAPAAGSFRVLVGGSGQAGGRVRVTIEQVDVGGESMEDFFSRFTDEFSDSSS